MEHEALTDQTAAHDDRNVVVGRDVRGAVGFGFTLPIHYVVNEIKPRGGEATVETFRAIQDIGRWWP